VQHSWYKYTLRVDHMVEEALRMNVKRCQQDLLRSITGDFKTGPSPLFLVQVVLDGNKVGVAMSIHCTSKLVSIKGIGVVYLGNSETPQC
jgi:dynein heavy chain